MARIIQGTPVSWDPSMSSIRFPETVTVTAWSTCSRFIAAAHIESPQIVILDSVTLEKLHTVHHPQEIEWQSITFSPDGQILTGYSRTTGCIISWDLHTGGPLCNINTSEWGTCSSLSYSACGTMIGGLFDCKSIIIYNVLLGTLLSSYPVQQPVVETIWTCGENLQFATIKSGSITIWQTSFTSTHEPIEVDSLPTPYPLSSETIALLPTFLYLAFIYDGKVLVWDIQNKKVLLDSPHVEDLQAIYFSPNGNFFVYGSWDNTFQIWKKSPVGYLFYQKFEFGINATIPLISPNGESVITSNGNTLQLWHTESYPTPISNISMETSNISEFFVDFSPDESLVAVTARSSSKVTVLDTKSGNLWLTIDTDMETCGLKMTDDRVIVVGNDKIVTWDLPPGDHNHTIWININDSNHTTILKYSLPSTLQAASISPSLDYLAAVYWQEMYISIYDMYNGEELEGALTWGRIPGFNASGHEVWCTEISGEVDQWNILQENRSGEISLNQVMKEITPLSGFPWHSPYGRQVTDDGWILCPSGKRLLWLPHYMRQDMITQRKWSGKFLVMWNWDSLEPSIIELYG